MQACTMQQKSFHLASTGPALETYSTDLTASFSLQVMAVHSAIVKGAKQICDVSNKEMLELMDITDEVRKQIGRGSVSLASQCVF